METLSHYAFPLRWQYERDKDIKGIYYSLAFHTFVFVSLFIVLNVTTPIEPSVQVFSVALMEEASSPPPPKKSTPKPPEPAKKKETPPPPPPPPEPVVEKALNLDQQPKPEVKKVETKPFEFKNKQVVQKQKVEKKTPPKPEEQKIIEKKVVQKKPVEKKPTVEDELQELEQERLDRMKKRVETPKKEKADQTTNEIKVDAPEFPYKWYIEAVKIQIDQHWQSPLDAGSSIQQCIVAFVIDREGNVVESMIEKSSGIEEFDLAGLRAIAESKFPPLPVGFNDPQLRFHMGFIHEPE